MIPEKELIAIPTTCGTGSEVTNISVAIVREDNGNTTKLGLVSDLLIPSSVCLIPEMLKTLPYGPFASSAIDALIHAVESYLSPARATMTSELFGVKAMELILEGFRQIRDGGKDARFDYLDGIYYRILLCGNCLFTGRLRHRSCHVLPFGRNLPCAPWGIQLRAVRKGSGKV